VAVDLIRIDPTRELVFETDVDRDLVVDPSSAGPVSRGFAMASLP
jgi:hypothetical protein